MEVWQKVVMSEVKLQVGGGENTYSQNTTHERQAAASPYKETTAWYQGSRYGIPLGMRFMAEVKASSAMSLQCLAKDTDPIVTT